MPERAERVAAAHDRHRGPPELPGAGGSCSRSRRFPWGEDPAAWLAGVARAADEAGFAGLALMDHLIQIPQVDRAWEPIPEPWVTLGRWPASTPGCELGTLVTPVTFRPAGITAKAAATLDALTGGRAFVGIGAGWWDREHAAYGLPFPPARERLDAARGRDRDDAGAVGARHQGVRRRRGSACPRPRRYPRPAARIPIIVGGGGERRTLRIARAARRRVNVPSDLSTLDRKLDVLRRTAPTSGGPGEVAVTVLDLPVMGSDRDDTWARVERLRGNTPAAAYAARTHAGTRRRAARPLRRAGRPRRRHRVPRRCPTSTDPTTWAGSPACSPELLQLGAGQAEHPARHDQLLDLLGALEDVEDLGVAGPLLQQLGLAVAERARQLDAATA